MNKKMEDALNKQINEELFSAYLYFSMAAHFESENLDGFAGWMKAQAQEEVFHAMKIYTFVNERGGKAVMAAIKAPQTEWKSPKAAFEDSLEHEKYITGCIHRLVETARAEKDYPAEVMLQWFVTEQVEEEDSVGKVLEKLNMIGDQPHLLLMLDRELGARQTESK